MKQREREGASHRVYRVYVCALRLPPASERTVFREYSAEQVARTCSSTCFMFQNLPPTPIGFKSGTFICRPTFVGGKKKKKDSWILNPGVPALALITHEPGVVWRWRRLTPTGGGEMTLFASPASSAHVVEMKLG